MQQLHIYRVFYRLSSEPFMEDLLDEEPLRKRIEELGNDHRVSDIKIRPIFIDVKGVE